MSAVRRAGHALANTGALVRLTISITLRYTKLRSLSKSNAPRPPKNLFSFEINNEKFNNSVNSVNFNNLKNFENVEGFEERLYGNFFREGKVNEWKNKLSNIQIKNIENNFEKELKELNYL